MITITVSRAAKINLGNYENTDVSIQLSAEYETYEQGVAELTPLVNQYIKDSVKEIKAKKTF